MGSTVVTGSQGSESFLASCVPNLQLYILIFELYSFDFEINANCIEKIIVE
jgi:hypothetical protein